VSENVATLLGQKKRPVGLLDGIEHRIAEEVSDYQSDIQSLFAEPGGVGAAARRNRSYLCQALDVHDRYPRNKRIVKLRELKSSFNRHIGERGSAEAE